MSNENEFTKKPIPVKATQWFKNGDHPNDDLPPNNKTLSGERSEGKVVRYYRTPLGNGKTACKHCTQIMYVHGWIDTLEGGHIVCPSDWIITGVRGEYYPIKDSIFRETYEDAKKAHSDKQRLERIEAELRELIRTYKSWNNAGPELFSWIEREFPKEV